MAVRAVPCQLNGHELMLRLDMGAMAALEDHGCDLESLVGSLQTGKFSAKRIQLLLWAMLQGEEPAPTLKEVGRWVDGSNFALVVERIGEALRLAFPESAKESPPGPPAAAGTGAPSSGSPPAPSPSP